MAEKTLPVMPFYGNWKKNLYTYFFALCALLFLPAYALFAQTYTPPTVETTCGYNVTTVAVYNPGTNQTTFTWTIVNRNPGNGQNGTFQDLSHWSQRLGTCVDEGDLEENGWTYGTDGSLGENPCLTGDLLKFDFGTNGSTPTVYTLVLNGSFVPVLVDAVFKTASGPACCYQIWGVGCCTLALSTTPTNVACNGAATGAINLTVTGAAGTPDIEWEASDGGVIPAGQEDDEDLTGLVAGTYTVTVTDDNGCEETEVVTITEPAAIDLTANVTPTTCTGSTGAIDLSVSGGTPGYTYSWSNGATTQDISGLAAGTYTVTVTDANGCTEEETYEVGSNVVTPTINEVVTPTICTAAAGAIDITVSGGTAPYTFAWTATNGGIIPTGQEDDEDLTGLVTGSYTVTVTDANGCTAEETFEVGTTTVTITIAETITPTTCTGSTGAIALEVSGGTGPYTFAWVASNGGVIPTGQEDDEDLTGLAAGDYTVTVTDANGCTGEETFTVTSNVPTINLTAEVTPTTCTGSTGAIALSVSGGTGPYSFSWTGPNNFTSQSEDLTGLAAGGYTVTVTDANGCTEEETFEVTTNTATITIQGVVTNVSCTGAGAIDLTVSGGTGPYTFAWIASGGGIIPTGQEDDEDLSGLVAGSYSVTVTDVNGCTAQETFTVEGSSTTPGIDLDVTHPGCGQTTGTITVTNPNAAYEYSLDDGTFGPYPVGGWSVAPGPHTVTVRNGTCEASASETVNQPGGNLYVKYYVTDETCKGYDGAINLVVSGGSGSYTYDWADLNTSPEPEDRTGLKGGTYTVIVRDKYSGCYKEVTIYVKGASPLKLYVKGTNPTCDKPKGGSITGTVSGGKPPYKVSIDNFATYKTVSSSGGSYSFTYLPAGSYTVKVKDYKGCRTDAYVKLEAASNLYVKYYVTDESCKGYDGAINLVVSGGSGKYSYDWADLSSSPEPEDRTGLKGGTYTVKVRDKYSDCYKEVTIYVKGASKPDLYVKVYDPTCEKPKSGSISGTISGGKAPYKVSIDNFNTYQTVSSSGGSFSFTYLGPGTYTVKVKDYKHCHVSKTVYLEEPECEVYVGCSQGFWKNHTEFWDGNTDVVVAAMPSGLRFTKNTNFFAYFGISSSKLGSGVSSSLTMQGAINLGGGGCKNLARQGVAALLNAAHFGSAYPDGYSSFTALYNAIGSALKSGNCSALASALDKANNTGCPLNNNSFLTQMEGSDRNSSVVEMGNELKVAANPNPFGSTINFNFVSPVSGKARLEVYDVLGRRLAIVYEGMVDAGTQKSVHYSVPPAHRTPMIYRLTVGGKTSYGKLLPGSSE